MDCRLAEERRTWRDRGAGVLLEVVRGVNNLVRIRRQQSRTVSVELGALSSAQSQGEVKSGVTLDPPALWPERQKMCK